MLYPLDVQFPDLTSKPMREELRRAGREIAEMSASVTGRGSDLLGRAKDHLTWAYHPIGYYDSARVRTRLGVRVLASSPGLAAASYIFGVKPALGSAALLMASSEALPRAILRLIAPNGGPNGGPKPSDGKKRLTFGRGAGPSR